MKTLEEIHKIMWEYGNTLDARNTPLEVHYDIASDSLVVIGCLASSELVALLSTNVNKAVAAAQIEQLREAISNNKPIELPWPVPVVQKTSITWPNISTLIGDSEVTLLMLKLSMFATVHNAQTQQDYVAWKDKNLGELLKAMAKPEETEEQVVDLQTGKLLSISLLVAAFTWLLVSLVKGITK